MAGGYPSSIYNDGKITEKSHNADLVDRLETMVRNKLAARRAKEAGSEGESE